MSKIIFDIETAGQDFDSLDETSQESFLRFAQTEEEVQKAKDSLSLYPVTAEIITIGMLEAETDEGMVFFQNGGQKQERFQEGNITFESGTEKDILTRFWQTIKKSSQIVTFNGRMFDCPFIMIRSAINGIKGPKNIMPYRYAHNVHIDLADQLSFYGASQRKFSLHMWCNAFGIESPKNEGIAGEDVKGLYEEGKYHDIARYCYRDIQATKELFLYWDTYLKY